MSVIDLILISLRMLGRNKLRSFLTILGIMIGIAAVMTMVSIGQGASELVKAQFKNLGANVIVVTPASSRTNGVRSGLMMTLTEEDALAIATECPSVLAVSPLIGTGGQVIRDNINWAPKEMLGAGPDYIVVRNWPVEAGRFLTDRDVATMAKYCVIGQTVADKLFPDENPIGQRIRIRNIPFDVIGVLSKKGANLFGQDQDDIILMPYTTVRKRLEGSPFANVGFALVSARSEQLTGQAVREIRVLLTERHRITPGDEPDFDVRNMAEIENVMNMITGTLTAMLSAIAAISLVVGGVGIMNIMLVSVTERTREIGIRMALGARPSDILWQFLVESAVLSSVGGVIGIALGVAASAGLTWIINKILPSSNWPFVVSIPAAIVALLFAAAVGVFFVYYPARRASQLDPIEALRYD
ncbi:MAG: ABC transporter permease [Planctomycetes bacterium]|nr:ABC transporter permease [Planctomycetota bacterium]